VVDQIAPALLTASPPGNQEVVDAAKAAYVDDQSAVDATTYALVASLRNKDLAAPLAALPDPDSAAAFFACAEVQTALGVIRRTSLKSFSVGAFTKSLPGGGPGMIGFAGDVLTIGTESSLILTLDVYRTMATVDPAHNLQYGVWTRPPTGLHDDVIGFYATTTVQGIQVNLKVLLDDSLRPCGFVASAGATVPLAEGVFSGATRQGATG
jgi:hypothetical protein